MSLFSRSTNDTQLQTKQQASDNAKRPRIAAVQSEKRRQNKIMIILNGKIDFCKWEKRLSSCHWFMQLNRDVYVLSSQDTHAHTHAKSARFFFPAMPGASSTTLPATASNSKGSKQILDKSRTHNTLQLNQDTQQAITQQKQQRPSLSSRSQDEAWVDISDRRLPNTRLGALYPGSKFVGSQECEAKSYQVTVEIQVRLE